MTQNIKYLLLLLVTFCFSLQSEANDVTWDVSSSGTYSFSGTNNVTLKNRTFTAGAWTSICLPFDASKEVLDATFGENGYNIQKFKSYENSTISFEKVTSIIAATPYFIKVGTTISDPIFKNVNIKDVTSGWKNVTITDGMVFRGYYYAVYAYNLVNGQSDPNAYILNSLGSLCSYKTWGEISYVGDNQRYGTEAFIYTSTTLTTKPTLDFEGGISSGTNTDGESETSGGSSVSYPQLTDIPTIYLQIYDTQENGTYDTSKLVEITQKNSWYNQARITIVDGNKTIKERDELVGIRGRGNSTWGSGYGKYAYRLKFPQKTKLLASYDSSGNEINNYANAKSWTLLANKGDYSLIRNALTAELGKYIGLPFVPAYKFVDLYINSVYHGTYQISDQVQVATDRVNVNSDTGWFLSFEDNQSYYEDPYINVGNCYANIKNPETTVVTESGETTDAQYNSMKTWMRNWLSLLNNENFTDTGWRQYVDLNSLVNYIIGIDITGDPDGGVDNVYMYKEAEEAKLHFGPMWDYDLAYGNAAGAGRDRKESHFWGDQQYGAPVYFAKMFKDPQFMAALYKRWQEIYDNGNLTTFLLDKVEALETIIAQSQVKNFAANLAGSVAGSTTYSSHADAIDALKAWIPDHITWLNNQYTSEYNAISNQVVTTKPEITVYSEDGTISTIYADSWTPATDKPNSIAVVDASANITGTNIVVNNNGTYTCSNLVLTDGHPFYNPVKFTATTATYTRNVTQDYGAICLPYKVQDINSTTASFYALSSVSGANMMFSQTKSDGSAIGTGAYTPLLFKRKSSSVSSISIVSNNVVVKVSTTDKISDTVNGWTMRGVVSETSLTADNLYQISDATNGKIAKTNSITVSPFCAYLTNDTNTTTPLTITLQTATVSGDVNNDGKVDITDIIAVIAYLNNNTALANQSAADMDSSGTVTKDDLDALVQKVLITK